LEDARPLDELANDLTTNHVLGYYAFNSGRVHSIIQRGRAARPRQRRKPGAESRLLRNLFAHEHIGPLRAATETTLPQ
jgi:hypothetical protein